ncbi:MAG: hypothetical protein JXJ22_01050 [Bacteroidales bacterium]|nr:hypothetical protein [Bacteroidales bacterium]
MNTKNFSAKTLLLILGFIGMTGFGLNWHMALAAWLTPVFLLLFIRNSKAGGFVLFFLVSIIAGIISRTCFALVDLFIVHLSNGLLFGITFSIPYLIDRLLYKKNKGFYTTLIFPASVVLIEYLNSLLIGTWGTVAHTQYVLSPLIQMVSVTGLFGLSFLVCWFGSVTIWMVENDFSRKRITKGILIYIFVFLAFFIYGEIRITFLNPDSNTVRTAGISGEIDIHKIVEDEYKAMKSLSEDSKLDIPEEMFTSKEIIDRQIEHTISAAREGAKIIVWNEISLILNKQQVGIVCDSIKKIAAYYKIYILMAFMEENTTAKSKPFNNKSVLFKPDGTEGWDYLKSALHPKAEAPVINSGDFIIPYIDTEYGRLGNVICYDMDFPEFIKQAGRHAVDIMLVPAYDWAEITPLHPQMAAFEAIQNGFSLLRPNGKGLSAAYDYLGNVIARFETYNTSSRILYADIPVKSRPALYSKIGNVFCYICALFLIAMVILKIVKRK